MFILIAVVSFVLLCIESAFGAHPLITDDTGTQGKGKSQVEVTIEYKRQELPETTTQASDVVATLSYGVNDGTDIFLAVPHRYARTLDPEGTHEDGGISDGTIGMKWRFHEKGRTSLALKPYVSLSGGSKERGLARGAVAHGLFLILTSASKSSAFHVNLGYGRDDSRIGEKTEIWHGSIASEFRVHKSLRFVGNVGMERNRALNSETSPSFVLIGAIYSASRSVDIDLGVKSVMNDGGKNYSILAGFTKRY